MTDHWPEETTRCPPTGRTARAGADPALRRRRQPLPLRGAGLRRLGRGDQRVPRRARQRPAVHRRRAAAGRDRHELPDDGAAPGRRAGGTDVDVEPWVAEEKRAVTEHLAATLRPHAADVGGADRARRAPARSPRSAPARWPGWPAASPPPAWTSSSPPTAGSAPRTRCPRRPASPTPRSTCTPASSSGIAPEAGPGRRGLGRPACSPQSRPAARRSATCCSCRPPSARSGPPRCCAAGALAVVDSWPELADLLLPGRPPDAAATSDAGPADEHRLQSPSAATSPTARARSTRRCWRAASTPSHTWLSAPHTQATFPADVAHGRPSAAPSRSPRSRRADLVVSNDHIPLDWEKRPGTTYLQTWHGTPLKRIHHDVLWAPEGRLDYLEQDIARWDLLLSPNPASTERLRKAFGFTGADPRDRLPAQRRAEQPGAGRRSGPRVRAELGIADGPTAVLYTPTWRDDLVFDETGDAGLRVPDRPRRLRRRGSARDHVLLLRLHNMVTGPARRSPRARRARRLRPAPTSATCTWPPTSWSPTTRRRCSTSPSPASRCCSSPTTWTTTATSCAASTSTSPRSPPAPLLSHQQGARRRDRRHRRDRRRAPADRYARFRRDLLLAWRTAPPPSASSTCSSRPATTRRTDQHDRGR